MIGVENEILRDYGSQFASKGRPVNHLDVIDQLTGGKDRVEILGFKIKQKRMGVGTTFDLNDSAGEGDEVRLAAGFAKFQSQEREPLVRWISQ